MFEKKFLPVEIRNTGIKYDEDIYYYKNNNKYVLSTSRNETKGRIYYMNFKNL
jgi:hypothetical protein